MSLPKLYFENNMATISVHPAGYAQLTYHAGKSTSDDLEAILKHTGDLLWRYRWHMLLEDHQQLGSLTAEQQEMMRQYWQKQTGLLGRPLCVATVMAQSVFVRLSIASLRHELQTTDIKYYSFKDTAAANSWMLGQIERLERL